MQNLDIINEHLLKHLYIDLIFLIDGILLTIVIKKRTNINVIFFSKLIKALFYTKCYTLLAYIEM